MLRRGSRPRVRAQESCEKMPQSYANHTFIIVYQQTTLRKIMRKIPVFAWDFDYLAGKNVSKCIKVAYAGRRKNGTTGFVPAVVHKSTSSGTSKYQQWYKQVPVVKLCWYSYSDCPAKQGLIHIDRRRFSHFCKKCHAKTGILRIILRIVIR